MSIFGPDANANLIEGNFNKEEFLEQCIYDEISRLPQERIQEFVKSEQAEVMVNEGVITKRTLVRLSKTDDLERRTGMAALQLAKDADDALFNQLVKNRIKEKELLEKIKNKYYNKATKVAKIGQKDFLKNKIPVGFMRK